jgi:hypothetical protein
VPAPEAEAPTIAALSPGTAASLTSPAAIGGAPAGASSQPTSAAAASESPPVPASSAGTPRAFRAGPNDVYLHPLRRGARVIAGTVLGHVGANAGTASAAAGEASMLFQIRPAGRGAPLIDPKPILDGWVQLENSSIFRAKGANPFLAAAPSAGQVLLESKGQLQQQVLASAAIRIYSCGRQDIEAGQVDRRVLATLEFLAVSGLHPTVTALRCGHRKALSASDFADGDAVDISRVNGIPIAGHQGAGSITDTTVRKLLGLQGSMKPRQIISLMRYPHTDNTRASGDHYDRIEVGFQPLFSGNAHAAGAFSSGLSSGEWIRLIARLGEIPNPTVRSGPSPASIPDTPPGGQPGGKEANGHG